MAAKSIPLFAAFLLGLTFGRCAVAHAGAPVEFDLRFGPSRAGVGRPLRDLLDRSSFSLDRGGAVRWQPSKSRWGIQAEVLYASRFRGHEQTDSLSFIDGAPLKLVNSLQVHYLQSTLLARGSLRRGGKVRPYALAGPYFAWRISSKLDLGFTPGDDPIDPANVRARDAGLILGIGLDYVVADADRLSFEVRWNHGLSDVLTDEARVPGSWRALTIQLAFAPFPRRD